jgi:hypothetical protein
LSHRDGQINHIPMHSWTSRNARITGRCEARLGAG